MIRSTLALIAFVSFGLTLAVPLANAQQMQAWWIIPNLSIQQRAAFIWHDMSECGQLATKKFPDHTPEGNAKREAARLDCFRDYHLPITSQGR